MYRLTWWEEQKELSTTGFSVVHNDYFQSIAVNRDMKKKNLFFEKVVMFCQFRPLTPFSRWIKGCKGALSHEKSREGLTSFSARPVSLENFYCQPSMANFLKTPAYKWIDCDNVVVCNHADWDENQPRFQGPLLLPLREKSRRGP